jgi:hypothetical protein
MSQLQNWSFAIGSDIKVSLAAAFICADGFVD